MIKSVIKKGDPLLGKTSRKVDNIAGVESLITDLWDTLAAIQELYPFAHGSGIAAPQIGQLWRVNVVEYKDRRYTLINGRIKEHSDDKIPMREGCLSFFSYRGSPLRYRWVTVEALDLQGELFELHAEGVFSSLLQHELDHLDGKLYDVQLAEGDRLTLYSEMPKIP